MSSVFYLGGTNADLSGGEHFEKYLEESTETAGSITISIVSDNTTWFANYGFTRENIPDNPDWESGNITVKVNVTSVSRAIDMYIDISRIDSNGNVLETSTNSSATQTLNATGVYTFTVSDCTWSAGNNSDRLRVNYYVRGTHNKQTSAIDIETGTTNTEVSTPIVISPFDDPVVTSSAASAVTRTSATLNGELTSLGDAGSVDVYFEWREVGASTWNTTTLETKTTTGTFDADIIDLNFGTTYEFRSVGKYNRNGTDEYVYGGTLDFTTDADEYNVTVSIEEGQGTVDPVAGIHVYEEGQTVTITANATEESYNAKIIIDSITAFDNVEHFGSAEFTMPSEDVTVKVYFIEPFVRIERSDGDQVSWLHIADVSDPDIEYPEDYLDIYSFEDGVEYFYRARRYEEGESSDWSNTDSVIYTAVDVTPEGGSEAVVNVAAEGSGRKTASGSSEASVTVSAEGAGTKAAIGASESAVSVHAEGGGEVVAPVTEGGSEAEVIVLAEAAGMKQARSPPADAEVITQAEGAGQVVEEIPTSGLVLHLDADSIIGLDDNDTVTTWEDLSGEGNDATAGGGPTYKTSVLNGKPVVRFDGTDDYYKASGASLNLDNDLTTLIVFILRNKRDSTTNYREDLFNKRMNYTNEFPDNDGSTRFAYNDGSWRTYHTNKNSWDAETGYLLTTQRDRTGGSVSFYVDGEFDVERSSTTGTPDTSYDLVLGGSEDAGGAIITRLSGDIAEILIYDRALSTAEREDVEEYLGVKWLGWEAEPEGGSEAETVISAEGQGTKQTAGSSESTTNITAEGAGAKQASGGSEAGITVSTEGQGVKWAQGASEASVIVSSEGEGQKALVQSGSETQVIILSEAAGTKRARSPPADVEVAVGAEGTGAKTSQGSSESTVEVSAEGTGAKGSQGNSESSVIITAEGAGEAIIEVSGGSESQVVVSAEAGGVKQASGGSESGVSVSAEGQGSKIASGASESAVIISSEGNGKKIASGNSESTVEVSADGAGIIVKQGGSESTVEVSADGAGIIVKQGGSESTVEVSADGAGVTAKQGGSESTVEVSSEGQGSKVVSGSSEAAVNIDSEGAGQKVASGAAESMVQTEAEGAGEKATSGSSEGELTVIAEGGGHKVVPDYAEGGSQATTTVSAEGVGEAFRQGSSEAAVTVFTEGVGQSHKQDNSESQVTVAAQGEGKKGTSGASEAVTFIGTEGEGASYKQGASEAVTSIGTEGEGFKIVDSSSETSVIISTEESGQKAASDSSESVTSIGTESAGQKVVSNSSETSVVVSAEGLGIVIAEGQGGSDAKVDVATEGSGTKTISGGSEASAPIVGEGQGTKSTKGSVEAETVIISEGQGLKSSKGTSEANVVVSTEGLGEDATYLLIRPTGIPSEEVFGTPKTVQLITPTGIPSEEVFGDPAVLIRLVLIPTGILSEEVFGDPGVLTQLALYPTGIPSEEVFGTPKIHQAIHPIGVPSEETFGTPELFISNLYVRPTSIPSEETFGTATLDLVYKLILPTSIPSEEALGVPTVGRQLITGVGGIPSQEAFGTPMLFTGFTATLELHTICNNSTPNTQVMYQIEYTAAQRVGTIMTSITRTVSSITNVPSTPYEKFIIPLRIIVADFSAHKYITAKIKRIPLLSGTDPDDSPVVYKAIVHYERL